MTREVFKLMMAIGVLLNSALYLLTVFVMGVLLGQAWIWRLDVAAIGCTYLLYICQFTGNVNSDDRLERIMGAVAPWFFWLALLLAIAAGLPLLWFR